MVDTTSGECKRNCRGPAAAVAVDGSNTDRPDAEVVKPVMRRTGGAR
jgi:hypothetical protein